MFKLTVKNNMSFCGRFIAATVLFAIVLLCVVSLTVPPPQLRLEKKIVGSDDLIVKIGPNNIQDFNSCTLMPDGKVVITGDDAYIIFNVAGTNTKTVKINFKIPSDEGYYASLYYDSKEGFDGTRVLHEYVGEDEAYICFSIPDTNNNLLRLDIQKDYTLDSIELHSNEPDVIEIPIFVSYWSYVIAVLIALFASVVFFFFDKYVYPVSEKIKNFYICNYKKILTNTLIILCAVIIAIGIEYILGRFVFGVSSVGAYFNMYRYFFIACVISALIFLIRYIKRGDGNGEKLFAILMLITGICMILCAPFGHTIWDYETHSRYVLDQSYVGKVYVTMADEEIITNAEYYYSRENVADNLTNIEYINSLADKVIRVRDGMKTTIVHIPAGLVAAVLRFVGFSYTTVTVIGRAINLCVYTLLCYCAMRKLKSGKMILATIAFFPTNIFLATNYSYDWWLTGLIMLGMAYFINELQHPQKMPTAMDTVIMCGAFILACLPKQIYMPIMILPFFMFKKWESIEARKKYYAICVSMFILMFVLLVLRSIRSVSGGGDMRGGSNVNAGEQISFILGHPLRYTKILLNFLKEYLSIGSMKEYITNFAYLRSGIFTWVYIVMLVITSLTDKCESDRFKGLGLLRIVSIVLFFGVCCLVATSMYVIFTEVGSDKIAGCQERYVIPLLFPLLVIIASPGIVLKINRRIYDTVLLTILSTAVFCNIGHSFLYYLM